MAFPGVRLSIEQLRRERAKRAGDSINAGWAQALGGVDSLQKNMLALADRRRQADLDALKAAEMEREGKQQEWENKFRADKEAEDLRRYNESAPERAERLKGLKIGNVKEGVTPIAEGIARSAAHQKRVEVLDDDIKALVSQYPGVDEATARAFLQNAMSKAVDEELGREARATGTQLDIDRAKREEERLNMDKDRARREAMKPAAKEPAVPTPIARDMIKMKTGLVHLGDAYRRFHQWEKSAAEQPWVKALEAGTFGLVGPNGVISTSTGAIATPIRKFGAEKLNIDPEFKDAVAGLAERTAVRLNELFGAAQSIREMNLGQQFTINTNQPASIVYDDLKRIDQFVRGDYLTYLREAERLGEISPARAADIRRSIATTPMLEESPEAFAERLVEMGISDEEGAELQDQYYGISGGQ